jgi:oxygen-independent coproporphyrinogen III oxidase
MKHYHENLNKKSRLTLDPLATLQNAPLLAPLEPAKLRARIDAALRIQNDYYPCFDWTFPPPITQKARGVITAEQLFEHPSVVPGRYSVYLHVPFCASLCKFCYYPVIPGQRDAEMERYVDYLLKEASLYAPVFAGQECESIYLGGGTPTHLPSALLERLIDGLTRRFRFAPGAEFSIESAPGSIPEDKLLLLKQLGVNRLSYGIQTLDEQLLAGLNRNYTVAAARNELRNAVRIIGNVNIDTMYGFEGESEHALLDTLREFVTLGVPCVSIYALDSQRCNSDRGKDMPARDAQYDRKIETYRAARDYLAANGFRPVLQNIFLQPERASYKHQLRRWENLPLVALGISSTGYAPRRLYQNPLGIKPWVEKLDRGELPVMEWEDLTAENEIMREVVSQLRFTEVNLAHIRAKYNTDIGQVYRDLIAALVDLGYLENRNGMLRLTDAAAHFNNIIPMLFAPDDFKEIIYGLPEEYREKFPLPYVLTQVGATQTRGFQSSRQVA